jgi:lipid A 4'-phosphatase
MSRRAIVLDWMIPIVLLVALTIPFYRTDLDMRLAHHFYVPGHGFPVGGETLWLWLKHYGVIPPIALACGALGVFLASFRQPRLRPRRRDALFLVLVMALGPGLVVNNVFKENWGRPRPRDMVEFGGKRDYVPPLVMSPREYGASFMSGHAATAFYLLTPFLLLRRRSPWKAAAMFALGILYGTLMGYALIAQGAHFLSDIVWALGVVYLTGLALFYLMRLQRGNAGGVGKHHVLTGA